jgi:hypothetical protein
MSGAPTKGGIDGFGKDPTNQCQVVMEKLAGPLGMQQKPLAITHSLHRRLIKLDMFIPQLVFESSVVVP